jgi:hypothetical protein
MSANAAILSKESTSAQVEKHFAWRAILHNPWTWIAVLGFALLITRCETATFIRISRDEGAFLTIAQEILHGRLPYRDAFDHKSPGIYYLLAGVLVLTGHFSLIIQILSARALAVLASTLAAMGLVVLGRRWWRLEVGVVAALIWLYAVPLYEGNYVLTEPFATALTLWAVVVMVQWPKVFGIFVAGLLISLGALFKQTAFLALPGMIIIALALGETKSAWYRPTRQQIGRLGALAAGVIVPWLVVVSLFALAGGLQPMFNQVVVANITNPSDSFKTNKALIIGALELIPFISLVPLAVVGVGVLRWLLRRARAYRAPGIGSIACVAIGGLNLAPFYSHAYLHYWLSVLPWAALLTALGLMVVADWIRPSFLRFLGSMLSFLNIPLGQRRTGVEKSLAMLVLGVVLAAHVWGLAMAQPPYYTVMKQQIAVGAWITQLIPQGARLLVAPAEPEYYYLSGQLPVTSFVYLLPVNLTPTLLGQVLDALRTHQFDRVVWYDAYEDASQPVYVEIHQQLVVSYHSISVDTAIGLTLFAPDYTGP